MMSLLKCEVGQSGQGVITWTSQAVIDWLENRSNHDERSKMENVTSLGKIKCDGPGNGAPNQTAMHHRAEGMKGAPEGGDLRPTSPLVATLHSSDGETSIAGQLM